jgi:hypothetical protein
MVLFDGTSGKKVKGNNAVVTAQGLALLDDADAAANRATIGLNLVNNTSDINKPVSTAQQTALDAKANKGVNSDITRITGLTTALSVPQGGTGVTTLPLLKSALALDLVDNTRDTNKPVSTLQQAAIDASIKLPMGYVSGLATAVVSTSTISVSAGNVRDSTNTFDMKLTSTFNVALLGSGVAWQAGSANQKLDIGSLTSNTWYHLYIIRKTSDGSVDFVFSLSATAPTLPTGYAGFRRVPATAVLTNSSGQIIPFVMDVFSGRRIVQWTTPMLDTQDATLTTTATTTIISTPPGVVTLAAVNLFVYANNMLGYLSSLDTTDLQPLNVGVYTGFRIGYGAITDAATDSAGMQINVKTNTSSQVRLRANVSGKYSLVTLGWEE